MPSNKKRQRNVRVPAELERDIQKLAEGLYEAGLLPEPNWSGALVMVLMQAKKAGLMDLPPAWYHQPEDSRPGRAKKSGA